MKLRNSNDGRIMCYLPKFKATFKVCDGTLHEGDSRILQARQTYAQCLDLSLDREQTRIAIRRVFLNDEHFALPSTFASAMSAWYMDSASKWSEGSRRIYRAALDSYRSWADAGHEVAPINLTLHDVGTFNAAALRLFRRTIQAYHQHLSDTMAANTAIKYTQAVSSTLKWLSKQYGLRFPKVEMNATSTKKVQTFRTEQIGVLIHHLRTTRYLDPIEADVAFGMQLQLQTCLRFSDVGRIKAKHIHDSTLVMKTKKTGSEITAPILGLRDRLLDRLTAYATPFSSALWSYANTTAKYNEIAGQIAASVGIEGVTSHSLRKMGFAYYVSQGMSYAELMAIGGHTADKLLKELYAVVDGRDAADKANKIFNQKIA